ncbi:MAG TPA: DUF6524 family protein [Steroidobacteraceae bacterium]|nr:DUF6524 family protein [Steroidobacteraceae bacterium]
MDNNFTAVGLLWRFLLALALVLITFNPTQFSYLHWFVTDFPAVTPLKVVVGLGLLIAWIIFVRATLQSIGVVGVVLMAIFFGALIWMLVSWGWLDLHNTGALSWIILLIVSLVLTAGLSWAHIRRRLSGQATVDEVEEH